MSKRNAKRTTWLLFNKDGVLLGEGPTRTAALLSAHGNSAKSGLAPQITDYYVEQPQ